MADADRRTSTWRTLGFVALSAVVTLAAIDALAALVVPPKHLSEVVDGVEALRKGNPTTLVLGSSHARTFEVVDRELARRTGGTERIVAVPIEYGKMTAYEWVLDHRLLPLIDKGNAEGRRRSSLRRFILVTEWWDSCAPVEGQFPPNIPARAWTIRDFLDDVSAHGLTDRNRSFVAEEWRQLFHYSALMHDRGYGRLWDTVRERFRPTPASDITAKYDADVTGWQTMIEAGTSCLANPAQMGSLSRMLDSLDARRLDVTILLYPRKPATLTDRAKATTLARWSAIAADTAAAHGAHFVDLTYENPLTDSEFERDFDHVTASGNARFAIWSLDGPLKGLLSPATSGATR